MRSSPCSWVVVVVVATAGLAHAGTVELRPGTDTWAAGRQLDVLVDEERSLSFDDVVGTRAGLFAPTLRDVPIYPWEGAPHWLHVTYVNPRSEPIDLVVELEWLASQVDFYVVQAGRVRHSAAGFAAVDVDARRHPVVEANLAAGASVDVYVRISSVIFGPLLLTAQTKSAAVAAAGRRSLIIGCYFGVAVLLALVNLSLFFATRVRGHLIYICYLATVLVFAAAPAGVFVGLVPGRFLPLVQQVAFTIVGPLLLVTSTWFAQDFLELKKHDRQLNRVIQICQLLTVVLVLPLNLFAPARLGIVGPIVFFAGTVAAVAALVRGFLRDRRALRWFVPAWGILGVFGAVYELYMLSLLPANALTINAIAIGSAIEFTLLAIALPDRTALMKARAARDHSGSDDPTTPYRDGVLIADAVNTSRFARAAGLPRDVGHYRLLAEIGRGGMGVVYRGADLQKKKPVAVKAILPRSDGVVVELKRLEREAGAVAAIQHPHVVQLLDTVVSPEGELHLVMELLVGRPLDDLLDEGPVPASKAVHIALQLCEALGAAHAKGVVHRDVKAANIMLVSEGGDHLFVKVLDFGIALLLDDSRSRLTETNATIGSADGIAPEQFGGDSLGPAVDIYATGALLYRMLAGVAVFTGRDWKSIAFQHYQVPPVPLQQRAPEAAVPSALADAVMRCLHKKPKDRFPSMEALAAALRDSLQSSRK